MRAVSSGSNFDGVQLITKENNSRSSVYAGLNVSKDMPAEMNSISVASSPSARELLTRLDTATFCNRFHGAGWPATHRPVKLGRGTGVALICPSGKISRRYGNSRLYFARS